MDETEQSCRIDVIVPVYGGGEITRRCLESVLRAPVASRFELVVVDDASPEAELSEWLEEQARQGRFTLLRNEQNRGFVHSVNRGMALHPQRDVVLLNSDTEVANDWLDRLVRCAESDPSIATATPFSNNATICSYPFDGWSDGVPGGLGLAGLDALFARSLSGLTADLPTGVGFCMYVRRRCLDEIGLFDEQTFGRGYGEENDFCLSAAKAGWRNVLCADVFVFHEGGSSFGEGREALMLGASQALLGKHPDYEEWVRPFIADDPLAGMRNRVDEARCREFPEELQHVLRERAAGYLAGRGGLFVRSGSLPVMLHVLHGWGGGAQRWVEDFAAEDIAHRSLVLRSSLDRNARVVGLDLLEPMAGWAVLKSWSFESGMGLSEISNEEYRSALLDVLATFDVRGVLISSLAGHALDAFETGLPTTQVLHDLYPFCTALFGWFGEECRQCDVQRLSECWSSNPLSVARGSLCARAWMELRQAYVERVCRPGVRLVAPSVSVLERLRELLPGIREAASHVVPHGLRGWEAAGLGSDEALHDLATRRLRLVVPGRLDLHKGLPLLAELLPELGEFADVLLLGCGDAGMALGRPGRVETVRRYAPREALGYLRRFQPDVALLLSTVPESFSYTLSEMQACHLPVVSTNLGAFAERIQDSHSGFLVEPDARAILARLRSLKEQADTLLQVRRVLAGRSVRQASEMVDEHLKLLFPEGEFPATGVGHRAQLMSDEALGLQEARGLLEKRVALLNEAGQQASARLEEALQQFEDMKRRHAQAFAQHAVQRLEQELREMREHAELLLQQNTALLLRAEAAEAWMFKPFANLARWLRQGVRRRLRGLFSTRQESGGLVETLLAEPAPEISEAIVAAPAPDVGASSSHACLLGGEPAARKLVERVADEAGIAWRMIPPLPDGGDRAGRELVEQQEASLLRSGFTARFVAEPSQLATCFWYEGSAVESMGSTALEEASLAEECRVLLPSATVRTAFERRNPASVAELMVLDFPLAGRWKGQISKPVCARSKRQALGLPDAARFVVGMGRTSREHGLDDFIRVAYSVLEHDNDCYFVWLSAGHEPGLFEFHEHALDLISRGRLFMLEWEPFEPWMAAASVYLGVCRDGVYDAAAVEAVAAGLPVVVRNVSSLPDAFMGEVLRSEAVEPDLGRLGQRVLWQLNREPDADELREMAEKVMKRFGSDEAFSRFVRLSVRPEPELSARA